MRKTNASAEDRNGTSETTATTDDARALVRAKLISRKNAQSIFLSDQANRAPELKRIAELLAERYSCDLIWASSVWTNAFGVCKYEYQPLPLLYSVLLSIIRHPTLQLDLIEVPDSYILDWYEKARDILKAKMPKLLEEALSNLYYEVRNELLIELNGEVVVINDREQHKFTEQQAAASRNRRLLTKPQGPGRPGRFETKEELIREVQYALQRTRKKEKKITQDTILPYFRKAKRVPDSRKLRSYFEKFGLRWSKVKKL